jgi:hypothetical protein
MLFNASLKGKDYYLESIVDNITISTNGNNINKNESGESYYKINNKPEQTSILNFIEAADPKELKLLQAGLETEGNISIFAQIQEEKLTLSITGTVKKIEAASSSLFLTFSKWLRTNLNTLVTTLLTAIITAYIPFLTINNTKDSGKSLIVDKKGMSRWRKRKSLGGYKRPY